MRPIKFRAWDNRNKVMLYDIQLQYDGSPHATLQSRSFGECLEKGKSYDDIFIGDDLEIMQFTGLRDKDAKEVYEGDIVKKYHNINDNPATVFPYYEIFFEKGAFWLKPVKDNWSWLQVRSHAVEVIGNIYENPELLEERA